MDDGIAATCQSHTASPRAAPILLITFHNSKNVLALAFCYPARLLMCFDSSATEVIPIIG
jgi:hypothetical protein